MNAGNIYIGKTTPQVVVKLFREQFENDFELFLTLRCKELVSCGRMVLTFAGRKRGEIPMHGCVARVWELLAEALQHLVEKVHYTNTHCRTPQNENSKTIGTEKDQTNSEIINYGL